MVRVAVVAAVVLGMSTLVDAERVQPREFPRTKSLGAALVEYHDGLTQVVAAYYHSQRHHDGPWLLIEVGLSSSGRTLRLERDGVRLVMPSGRVVRVAPQRRWGADSNRARTLMQQARTTRHPVRTYFRGMRGVAPLRFFGRPEQGDTVSTVAQTAPEEVLLGDLMFESPTGAWEPGTYALEIEHNGGTAVLPIALQ